MIIIKCICVPEKFFISKDDDDEEEEEKKHINLQ